MSTITPFRLPDLGEGLTEGEILRWLVAPGETVGLNQPIVEVETAKAAVEIPSPYAGVVHGLLCDQGTTVDVGTPIIEFSVPAEPTAEASAPEKATEPANGRTAVLVGYGPLEGSATRRRRRTATPATKAALSAAVATASGDSPPRALAKPPVRKLARDLGVDLAAVTPTGPQQSVTRDDVHRAAGQAGATVHSGAAEPREQRIPVTGVRKLTAEAMVASAFTAPHVSVFLTVDATATMELLAELKQSPEFADIKVSPLLLVVKAVAKALRRHPTLNGSWSEETNEIVVKNYVNIGIAAATPRGLVVPNVKDADRLSTVELGLRLRDLTASARSGRVSPADLADTTFSITNIGVFGVDTGTPIIPPGQAAVLAVGTIAERPWVHEGAVVPRLVTTLALSFDHRMIDGEQGSKFLADVGRFLRQPALTLLAWD